MFLLKKKKEVKAVWLTRLSLINKGFRVFLCAHQLLWLSFFLCFYMPLLPRIVSGIICFSVFSFSPFFFLTLCCSTDFKVSSHCIVALSWIPWNVSYQARIPYAHVGLKFPMHHVPEIETGKDSSEIVFTCSKDLVCLWKRCLQYINTI